MNNIENALRENHIYIGKAHGNSMYPMLIAGRDRVVIAPPKFPMKKYDVVVYHRSGHYAMHRIVKVTKNGYITCGDNRTQLEKDITDKDIVGVLVGFYHGRDYVSCTNKSYIKYSKEMCRRLPVRRLKGFIKHLFQKLSISKKSTS